MARNRKRCQDNTVTSRQYDRRAIFVSGDVRFQDGDAVDLSKLGGRFFPIFFLFLSIHAHALAYLAITCTPRTTDVLWYSGVRDIRVLFMYDANQCAWRIALIRLNNVSPLNFTSKYIRPAASAHIKTTTLPAPLVMKFQM